MSTPPSPETYAAQGGGRCPACGSEDVTFSGVEVDPTTVTHQASCLRCGALWCDLYTLAGYTNRGQEGPR
jgi:hypothetical protein